MKALVLACTLIGISSAHAGFYTGNEVYPYCSSNKAFISGFVSGVFDKAEIDTSAFFSYVIEILPSDSKTATVFDTSGAYLKYSNQIQQYCTPKNATLQQVMDIFCQHLGANPADRHLSAAALFNVAMSQAWPCAPAKPKR